MRNLEPHISQNRLNQMEQLSLIGDLHHAITDVLIRQRPSKSEPRVRETTTEKLPEADSI